MSYILEALRRSQVERERGQVPGLHAQPTLGSATTPDRKRMDPKARLVAGTALLLVLGLLAWWLLREAAAPLPADLPARTSALANAPVLSTPAPVSPPPSPSLPPPPPAPAPLPMVVSAPVPSAVLAPTPARATATNTLNKPSAPAAPTGAVKASGGAPTLVVLSAEQRRELPALLVGGSVFSDTASSRFVIVNGQIVREGESAAPGVLVERIGAKALVLRWRELRFEWPL
jgi:general secretion pathway protein B